MTWNLHHCLGFGICSVLFKRPVFRVVPFLSRTLFTTNCYGMETYKTKPGDPRLGDIIGGNGPSCFPRFVLLGWEQDEGVARNGGRVGAANGPTAMLKRLPTTGPLLNAENGADLTRAGLLIGHFVRKEATKSQEMAAKELQEAVAQIIKQGDIPIVVGGGNDQSAPNGSAFLSHYGPESAVVNIDAHLDVRPLIENDSHQTLAHSGSPFRQLLETFPGLQFAVFACQGEAVSAEHVRYVKSKNGDLVWLREARRCQGGIKASFEALLQSFGTRSTFVSFDIDSIASNYCPGVSCPAVVGLTAEEALDVAFAAGKWNQTKLIDFSEFNPNIEEDRTARLLCQLIYSFMCGVASRS